MKWSGKAKEIAKVYEIRKEFVEKKLKLFSACGIKGHRFFIRGNKICVNR